MKKRVVVSTIYIHRCYVVLFPVPCKEPFVFVDFLSRKTTVMVMEGKGNGASCVCSSVNLQHNTHK